MLLIRLAYTPHTASHLSIGNGLLNGANTSTHRYAWFCGNNMNIKRMYLLEYWLNMSLYGDACVSYYLHY